MKVVVVAAALAVACASRAESARRPTMAVPLKDRVAVAVDGVADEAAWKDAPVLTHLISPHNSSPAGAQTAVRVLADAEALYLTVKSDRIPASARPKGLDKRDKAPQTVTFTVDASLAGAVWDAATGEKLADLAPGANAVRVPLGPDRLARLLYVGERRFKN